MDLPMACFVPFSPFLGLPLPPGHPLEDGWGLGRSQGYSGPPLPTDPAGLSSDSGLGGSSDGSSDVLAFGVGSVVDSVAEEGGCHASPALPPSPSPTGGLVTALDRTLLLAEGAESEDSSGEAEAWGLADVRELHPGLLAHRAARTRDLPALAAALAHGAEVNWADTQDEGKTPLVQAVLGVSRTGQHRTQVHANLLASSSFYSSDGLLPRPLLETRLGPWSGGSAQSGRGARDPLSSHLLGSAWLPYSKTPKPRPSNTPKPRPFKAPKPRPSKAPNHLI